MKKEDVVADLDLELQTLLQTKSDSHKGAILILLMQIIRLLREVKANTKK